MGFFNEVWSLDGGHVIKVARARGPLRQPASWLRRNRQEHELVSCHMRVPCTYHVRVRDRRGRPMSVILQDRLHGRLLSELSDEYLREPRVLPNLSEALRSLERAVQELGWLPDIIGGPPRWGLHDARNSNNLMVDDEGQVWLIDPGAFFFWFSTYNLVGRLYTTVLRRSAVRMLERLRRPRG
ncbi:MAG: hypothetical protein M3281_04415 [Chloroflexota bacterium]|nr:hypothetical protein [Chloroflexota bacterium]